MELTVRELARLEREKSEESGAKKRVRRLKQGSCSSSVGDDSLIAGQPLVKGSSKQISSERMKAEQDWLKLCEFIEEMKFETSEVEASSDFEGTFQKDSNSNFRKRIRRIKTSELEPIMLGKILAKTEANMSHLWMTQATVRGSLQQGV